MRITIKSVDDWVTVWKDRELVWRNHSCSLQDGLEALGIAHAYEYEEFVDDPYGDKAAEWVEASPL